MCNLPVTINGVCVTYHFSQLMRHKCNHEISGTFKMSRFPTNGRPCLWGPFSNAAAVCAALPQDKPLPHGVICKHSWALDLLHYAGSFYEINRFLNTPHPHARGKEPNLEFTLIIIRQNPSDAPTLTDLHKGQRNFLPRLSVRRIWLIVPLLICEFDESFNISRFFFFGRSNHWIHLHSHLARAPTVQLMLWTCSHMCQFQSSG